MRYSQKYWWLLVVVAAFFMIPHPLAWADPPSIDAYWQKVDQTQAAVADLENETDPAKLTPLAALANEWEGITQVKLDDGTIIPVNHSFLATQLRANPPNPVQLNELLNTLLAARVTWPKPQHTVTDLKPLAAILVQSEFQWAPEQPSPVALLWRRALEYLWEWLSPLMPEEAVITLNGSWFRYVLTILVSLLLALVLFFMMRELLANLVTEAEIAPGEGDGEEMLTAETAFKRAQTLSGAGDYRTAVRYLYLSSLLVLDERGLLRYDRSKTNREYLRSVAHLPKLAVILREVIEVFDRVWYGYQVVDETTYTQYAARVAELRQQK